MTQKIPPPPSFTQTNIADFIATLPAFNRWLLELTSILAASGGIDPDTIDGFTALEAQVATNTDDIASLSGTVGGQGAAIAGLQSDVTDLQNDIITINGQITSLSNRAQVFNGAGAPGAGLGVVGDWYANVGGAAGARIYIKTAPAVWTPFPF